MEKRLFLTPLADESIIYLRGRKIDEFLQGQLTCDLRPLSPERAVHGALCSVKGRVISDLWVLKLDDECCLLRLRRSLASGFAEHLARFAQFSRIKVSLEDQEGTVIGIYGKRGESAESLPLESPGDCERTDGALLLRSGPRHAQLILMGSGDNALASARDVLEAMNCATDDAGSAEAWRAEVLRDGHYALETEDSERFTPQALNYDERGLVSFNKGCYTGQEVVARLHYKGKSKQRLQVYAASTGRSPDVGSALHHDDASVGTVLRREAAMDGEGIVAAMVVAEHRAATLTGEQGEQLQPLGGGG